MSEPRRRGMRGKDEMASSALERTITTIKYEKNNPRKTGVFSTLFEIFYNSEKLHGLVGSHGYAREVENPTLRSTCSAFNTNIKLVIWHRFVL